MMVFKNLIGRPMQKIEEVDINNYSINTTSNREDNDYVDLPLPDDIAVNTQSTALKPTAPTIV